MRLILSACWLLRSGIILVTHL